MRKFRKALLAGAVLTSAFALAGCWDVHDVNDRTPILGMGFDYDQSGWRVTIGNAFLAQGGSNTYTGITHTGEGPTLTEAIENLRTRIPRRLYLGSTKVFVLGKGVVKDKSEEVLLFLLQRGEVDMTSFAVGTESTAQKILAQPDPAMGLSAIRLLKEFETERESRNGHIKEPLWKTMWGVLDTDDTLHIPMYQPLPKEGLYASGTVLISHGKMKLVLDREESVSLRWLLNLPGRNILAVGAPYEAWNIKTMHVHTTTRVVGNAEHLRLRIKVDAEVYKAPSMDLPASMLVGLERAAARTIVDRVTGLIRKMQEADVDGPEWKDVAEKAGFPEFSMRNATVEVMVNVRVAAHFAPSL